MPIQGRKRYNLVLPEELYNAVEEIAHKRDTSVVEILRKFVRLGLLAIQVEETAGGELFIREGDIERQILLI